MFLFQAKYRDSYLLSKDAYNLFSEKIAVPRIDHQLARESTVKVKCCPTLVAIIFHNCRFELYVTEA